MDEVVRVGPALSIPATEFDWRFSASSGPGGQHANTSNTKVELRWSIVDSPTLTDRMRERLLAKLGDDVRVVCQTNRSQTRNRAEAIERLAERVRKALVVERVRRPTRATRGSQLRRLDSKSQRSETKANRQRPDRSD